jgi:ABC-type transport system involved in Fe-S cluster assembly fused permease/ATPase subunit
MLGYIYRSVNQSLVDTEKLLKLLNEPTDIVDKPNADDLIVEDGEIEFGMLSLPTLSSMLILRPCRERHLLI